MFFYFYIFVKILFYLLKSFLRKQQISNYEDIDYRRASTLFSIILLITVLLFCLENVDIFIKNIFYTVCS